MRELMPVCLVLLMCALAACVSTPRPSEARDSAPSRVVRTAWLDDAMLEVAAAPVGLREGVLPGLDHFVLELQPPSDPLTDWYSTLRGSPVYAEGELVGIVHEVYGVRAPRLVGVLDQEFVTAAWRRANAGSVSCSDWDRIATDDLRAIRPGDAVWVLSAWGDVSVGVQGTVSDVRGDGVLMLTDDTSPYAPPRDGPTARLIARASFRVVGSHSLFGAVRLCDVGEPVGSVTWHGGVETSGVLGRVPPATDVRCIVEGPGVSTRTAQFHVVRSAGARALRWALIKALVPADFGVGRSPLRVAVRVDGDARGEVEVPRVGRSPIYAVVESAIRQAVGTHDVMPDTIEVRISPVE